MEELIISTKLEIHFDEAELSVQECELIERANLARERAYAPYSLFKVGAALLLANGIVVEGNNQENGAYPSGLCAERVAFFAASSQYPGIEIIAAAITASSANFLMDHPVAPCGACRQVMLEYQLKQKNPIALLMKGEQGNIIRLSGLTQLLPLYFNEEGLKK
jgi:cytidine deaminase